MAEVIVKRVQIIIESIYQQGPIYNATEYPDHECRETYRFLKLLLLGRHTL